MEVYSQRGIDLVVQRAGGSDNLNNTLPEQLLDRIAALPGVEQVMGGAVDLVSFQKYGIIGRLINGWPPDSPLLKRITVTSGRLLKARRYAQSDDWPGVGGELEEECGETQSTCSKSRSPLWASTKARSCLKMPAWSCCRKNCSGCSTGPTKWPALQSPPRSRSTMPAWKTLRHAVEALQPGLEVRRSTDFVEHVPQVRISRAVAWLTSAIALFIGAIGMLNTMVMSVFERTKEIGTLRAIGWRKSRIMRMVIGESLLLSIAGAALGSAGGSRTG